MAKPSGVSRETSEPSRRVTSPSRPLTAWRSRITGHGEESPDQLLANPRNWRIHPKEQQDALSGLLDQVGWVQDVIVNRTTGHVVDGHLRVSLAISRQEPTIPVVYVELSPDEEGLVLAAIDPIAAMAATDDEALRMLLADVVVESQALQTMLDAVDGVVDTVAFPDIPDGDRSPFRQMTFTVTAEQEETVREAMAAAKRAGGFEDTGNENSNGNALALVCSEFLR